MRRILVIGAAGQIGSELVPFLRNQYGKDNVIATGRKTPLPDVIKKSGPVIYLDALERNSLSRVFYEYEIDTVFHMASILSATGEKMPQNAWDINMNGLINVLEASRRYNIKNVIWPSSIAAFGPTTPRDNTPNITVLQPTTIYGITKVAGELLAEYYYKKYGLDIRSMRLLPMMYMPDCLKCMIDILEADNSKLKRRVYNITGMSFSAGEIAAEIKKHIPDFQIDYNPDFRQEIADSWPKSIDDSLAREEWSWNPSYDLASMTKDMIDILSKRL